MSWQALTEGNATLAAYGEGRLQRTVAYLATVDKNGAPRVHPVTPQLHDKRLFLFMHPTSPKGHDLQRGSHYALHCGVEANSGGEGEFYVRGTATQVHDPQVWELVRPGKPEEFNSLYILFELEIEQAFSMQYVGDDNVINRWSHKS